MTTALLAQNPENAPPPATAPTDETGAADAPAADGETEPAAAEEAATEGTESSPGEAAENTEVDVAPGTADIEDQLPQEGQTALPVEELAQLNEDKGVFWMGVIPVVLLALFVIVWAALAYWRQKKNWQDLGKDLELSDEPPLTKPDEFKTSPSTAEISRLPPTRQTERLGKGKDKKSKDGDDEDE